LLGVLILLAIAPSNAPKPLLDARSSRQVAEFSACFTRAQERNGRAWAFMASEHGGTFTDSGARGISASYWLQVRDSGAVTRVRLFVPASLNASPSISAVVEECR